MSVQVHDLMSYPAESIGFGMRYWTRCLGMRRQHSADIRRGVSMIEPISRLAVNADDK